MDLKECTATIYVCKFAAACDDESIHGVAELHAVALPPALWREATQSCINRRIVIPTGRELLALCRGESISYAVRFGIAKGWETKTSRSDPAKMNDIHLNTLTLALLVD